MPEYPDVVVYLEHIRRRAKGHTLTELLLPSPFVLRTVEPKPDAFAGLSLTGTERLGKKLVLQFKGSHFALIHLMIAGRLHWLKPGRKLHKTRTQAAFVFDHGTLQLTEAGSKRRAALHLVKGRKALDEYNSGGMDVFHASPDAFAERLRSRRHTLKRSLTDPHLFDGIGNAYSDEILHRAQLSPVSLSTSLDDNEVARLHAACVEVLTEWTDRLREEAGDSFPEGVTAFRSEMAVHGKYREPCPRCGTPVQRIRYAERETNYCPTCQTGGKLLADRALSRLLRGDWPKSLEELEAMRRPPQ